MALSALQMQERQTGIGGSDMAAVLGIDPWRQAIDVFYEKRPDLAVEAGYVGREVSDEIQAIMWGNLLEDPIADGYMKLTGRKVQRSNIPARHASASWLVSNIDRRVVGERRGVEIKNVSGRMAHRWGPSGGCDVAEYYLPQVMQYLLVMDFPVWDVAALVGGSDLRIYTIERDPEWDDLILDASADFWRRVEAGDPPPVDADAATAIDAIRRVYPGTDGSVVSLDPSMEHFLSAMNLAKATAKQQEEIATAARAHIMAAMGNAAVGLLPDGSGFTRKVVQRRGFEVAPTEYVDFRFSKNIK